MTGVIYARYSSDNQREESIEGQVRECKTFAKHNNIQIVDTYIDRAFSAKTDNRPSFQKMIKDSDKKVFDCVIVWKLDRFSRDRYDSAYYKRYLKKNNVKVISATEAISEGAEGILLESLLEGVAEYYSAELAEKTLRGMTENALACKSTGGLPPLGFLIDDEKHYQVDKNVAPMVIEAFNLYAEGATLQQIADQFNARGIHSVHGRKIVKKNISTMLHNRKYIGEYKFKDIVIPHGIPQIVSEELFERVQNRMSTNKKAGARHKAKEEYLLTTKLFCGKCKRMMVGESGTSRNDTTYRYYKCSGVKYHQGCDKKTVKKDWIENLVVEVILKILSNDELLARLADKVVAMQDQENDALRLLKKQLADIQKGIENLLNAMQMGIITESTKQRLDELEKNKNDLIASIGKEELKKPHFSKEQILFWFTHLRELNTAKAEYRRLLIDYFINAIYLYDDKMIITFNYKNGTKTIEFENLQNLGILSDSKREAEPESA